MRFNCYKNIKTANEIKSIETRVFLDEVFGEYGGFTGNELANINQQELPWIRARKDLDIYTPSENLINNYDIFDEYMRRI